jgi:UDP-N-acetylglucosamine--N-acetylmuramyl-(pentapeptide) pyrophosphoryl-undecaprenol N-acetylglucosamine transferase
MSTRKVMIMAGGTGGHVFPALALAEALRQRSCEVVWLGTRRGIEARLVPAAGIPVEWVEVGGLRGKGAATLLAAPLRLARALWQSVMAIRRQRPRVVVGLGGFVTGPGGLAAWLLRCPLVIHEQNAVAGFTNRTLSRFADEVLEAFPGSFAAGVPARAIGNPVRRGFFELSAPGERMATRSGPLRLLVVGGSQGAARLNATVPEALALLRDRQVFEVRHQAGERGIDAARAAYGRAAVVAQVTPFIDDIAAAYGWADLVICRSGALTVSELAAAGVASVLVPFPAAVDDHQTRNAGFLVARGAAVLMPEPGLSAQALADVVGRLCGGGRAALLEMADNARALSRPQATDELAAACLAAGGLS